MPSRSFAVAAVLLLTVRAAGQPAALGDKVVAYCAAQNGKQVGTGECALLADHALRAAGAKPRGPDSPNPGDYAWGRPVFHLEQVGGRPRTAGNFLDVRPGDIIQFRDTKWGGQGPGGAYWAALAHHTAVVAGVDRRGLTVRVFHQNFAGRKVVTAGDIRLNDLKEGWVRFYRPVPADGS
jgi:hypothetical protein